MKETRTSKLIFTSPSSENGEAIILPEEISLLVFGQLDLASFIKTRQVSKDWDQFLRDDALWKSVYQHPQNESVLYHGQLWRVFFQQAEDPNATVNTLLATYLQQVFQVTVNPKDVPTFLASRLNDLEKGVTPGGEERGVEYRKQYIAPWTAKNIVDQLNGSLAQFHQLIKEKKVVRIEHQQEKEKIVQWRLDEDNLKPKDIQKAVHPVLVVTLLKLRQLEQLLTTAILLYKLDQGKGHSLIAEEKFVPIVTHAKWKELLTARGLTALTTNYTFLMPVFKYEAIKKALATDPHKVTEFDKAYFDQMIVWFSKAAEPELLQAFCSIPNKPQIILQEPIFLPRISDRAFLQLALDTSFYLTKSLFQSPVFVQRLKQLPNISEVLIGLTQGKVTFNGMELQNKSDDETAKKLNEEKNRCMNFARGILGSSELTECLTDEQLPTITKLLLNILDLNEAIFKNPSLARRIASNYNLLKGLSNLSNLRIAPSALAKESAIATQITAETSLQLALLDTQSVIVVLEDNALSSPLELEHLNQLKTKYTEEEPSTLPFQFYTLRDFREKITSLIRRRQQERAEREKLALGLRTKSYSELLSLALSQESYAQLAAECLVEKQEFLDSLTDKELDNLTQRYNDKPIITRDVYRAVNNESRCRQMHWNSAIRGDKKALALLEVQASCCLEKGHKADYVQRLYFLGMGYAHNGEITKAIEQFKTAKKQDEKQSIPVPPLVNYIDLLSTNLYLALRYAFSGDDKFARLAAAYLSEKPDAIQQLESFQLEYFLMSISKGFLRGPKRIQEHLEQEWARREKIKLKPLPCHRLLEMALKGKEAGKIKGLLAAECLVENSEFLKTLSAAELDNLSNYPTLRVKVKNYKASIRPTLLPTDKVDEMQLPTKESHADRLFYLGQIRAYAVTAWSLCADYASLGDLANAMEWLRRAKKYQQHPPHNAARITRVICMLYELPDTYAFIRTEFEREFKEAKETAAKNQLSVEDYKKTLVKKYEEASQDLLKTDKTLVDQQKQVDAAIQRWYNHSEALRLKGHRCLGLNNQGEPQPDRDAEEIDEAAARIYLQRSAAASLLALDLEKHATEHYNQDFSRFAFDNPEERERERKFQDVTLYEKLSNITTDHFERKSPILKEHTGSKKVFYGFLAALTWIFLPFSIPMAIRAGTGFYFHAKNSSEKFAQKEVQSELQHTLSASTENNRVFSIRERKEKAACVVKKLTDNIEIFLKTPKTKEEREFKDEVIKLRDKIQINVETTLTRKAKEADIAKSSIPSLVENTATLIKNITSEASKNEKLESIETYRITTLVLSGIQKFKTAILTVIGAATGLVLGPAAGAALGAGIGAAVGAPTGIGLIPGVTLGGGAGAVMGIPTGLIIGGRVAYKKSVEHFHRADPYYPNLQAVADKAKSLVSPEKVKLDELVNVIGTFIENFKKVHLQTNQKRSVTAFFWQSPETKILNELMKLKNKLSSLSCTSLTKTNVLKEAGKLVRDSVTRLNNNFSQYAESFVPLKTDLNNILKLQPAGNEPKIESSIIANSLV